MLSTMTYEVTPLQSKMTDIESESKVCGMHKKSRIKLEWPIMAVDNEKNDCAMHEISRTELKCKTVTVEKSSQAN